MKRKRKKENVTQEEFLKWLKDPKLPLGVINDKNTSTSLRLNLLICQ
jgi:hypothetical protein